jgi:hypothetical protein
MVSDSEIEPWLDDLKSGVLSSRKLSCGSGKEVTENSFGDPVVMKRGDERCFAAPCPG